MYLYHVFLFLITPVLAVKPFFGGECLKIQKRQLTRNELVALNFIILGISLNRFGKVLIWVWNRCIKKTAIPYEELDFHYPDWAFIITGCIFFGVVVGVTLLYFAFIKQ